MTTTYITPTLLMGDKPSRVQAESANDIERAVRLIRMGRRALLPANAWEMARDVLIELRLSDDEIEGCLYFARTARVLPTRRSDD